MDIFVARSTDLAEGARRLVAHGTGEIAVIRAKGALRAFHNICPHQGGPVCEGVLVHRPEEILGDDMTYRGMRFSDDLHLVCPWHGWEFDISTGRCAGDGKHVLRRVDVVERDGNVYVQP